MVIDLSSQPVLLNVGVFVVAAVTVWRSGVGLASYSDLIATRTGIGRVFAGVVLLGVATSLPELATTVSAASAGAARLAGSNLLGGVAMQVALLSVVDVFADRNRPLTVFTPNSALLLSGVFLMMAVAMTSVAIIVPAVVVGGASLWSWGLAALYVLSLVSVRRCERSPGWEPVGEVAAPPKESEEHRQQLERRNAGMGAWALGARFAAGAMGVIVGGYFVATSGDALADQTGVGESVVGAVLVAITTSLPELSTTISAARMGAYALAVGNILGTNTLELALFLPADLAYRGNVFLPLAEKELFLAQLGIVVTAVYLWGVIERRNRTIGPMGTDSVIVLVVYLTGMVAFVGFPE
ncbi:MAG: sodium:calcium antiporter [Pseudomonadales bacterium]